MTATTEKKELKPSSLRVPDILCFLKALVLQNHQSPHKYWPDLGQLGVHDFRTPFFGQPETALTQLVSPMWLILEPKLPQSEDGVASTWKWWENHGTPGIRSCKTSVFDQFSLSTSVFDQFSLSTSVFDQFFPINICFRSSFPDIATQAGYPPRLAVVFIPIQLEESDSMDFDPVSCAFPCSMLES